MSMKFSRIMAFEGGVQSAECGVQSAECRVSRQARDPAESGRGSILFADVSAKGRSVDQGGVVEIGFNLNWP